MLEGNTDGIENDSDSNNIAIDASGNELPSYGLMGHEELAIIVN